MDIGARFNIGEKDPPLTREDVERLLQEAGSPDKLDLSGMNLQGINLAGFNLAKAILRNADLRDANLSAANLYGADLYGAYLYRADLFRADLREAKLREAYLLGADLFRADLRGANLREAVLFNADLYGADLYGADLRGADLSAAFLREANLRAANLSAANLSAASLSAANLSAANLRNAKLNGADLRGANLTDAEIDEGQLDKAQLGDKVLLHDKSADEFVIEGRDSYFHTIRYTTKGWPIATGIIPIRINEEPLTPYNLAVALTALTELTTKFWLIAKHRFDDLIEYTQTHDARFAKEAGATIEYARYNSPFNFGIQFDKIIPGIADATMTVVNGFTQREANLEKLELENQAAEQKAQQEQQMAAQKLKEAEQKAQQEQQMAALEKEKQELAIEKERLAIEEDRLALVEHRLDIQKKGLEDALALASKTVDILRPNADPDARAMMIQSVLPSILQLQNVTGLELALPPPKDDAEK